MSQTQDLNQKNLANLEGTLEICPRTQVKTVLVDALIVKESWGGKQTMKGNIAKISASADFEYYLYAQQHPQFEEMLKAKKDKKILIGSKIFSDFLESPKPELSGEQLIIQILKELTRARIQMEKDRIRDEARFLRMSQRIDKVYPISKSRIIKKAEEIFPDAKNQTWQNLFMGISADARTKKGLMEKEIENVLQYHPVWTEYLEKVTGIGPWFAGYLIATIGDPRNFKKTSNVWGLTGTRVDNFGKSQKGKTPFWKQQNLPKEQIAVKEAELKARNRSMDALDYDPFLKMTIVEILPGVLMKMKGMMEKKGTAHESPYNALIDSIRSKEQRKALAANPTKCLYCDDTNIINLGMKERDDDAKTPYFAGFCCSKTYGKETEHKFFNPAHIQRRVQRELGKKVIADIYHAMLYFAGENPRIFGGTFADGHAFSGNERLMFYLKK